MEQVTIAVRSASEDCEMAKSNVVKYVFSLGTSLRSMKAFSTNGQGKCCASEGTGLFRYCAEKLKLPISVRSRSNRSRVKRSGKIGLPSGKKQLRLVTI